MAWETLTTYLWVCDRCGRETEVQNDFPPAGWLIDLAQDLHTCSGCR